MRMRLLAHFSRPKLKRNVAEKRREQKNKGLSLSQVRLTSFIQFYQEFFLLFNS